MQPPVANTAFLHPLTGKPIAAVLFDLDGTLVDSAPDIASAINTVMADDGLAPLDVTKVRTLIGEGIRRLVEKAYIFQNRQLAVGDLDIRTAQFAGTYEMNIAVATRAYTGVEAGLEELRQCGVKIAVVSNKAQHLTDRLLRSLGLFHRFDFVMGARDDIAKKPAPDMLQFALRNVSAGTGTAIFVGDSIADVDAARAANLPCLLIEGGYTIEPAARLGAWKTVADFASLISLWRK